MGCSEFSGKELFHHIIYHSYCLCEEKLKSEVLHEKCIEYPQTNFYFVDFVDFLKQLAFKLDRLDPISEMIRIINVPKLNPRTKS